MEIDAHLVLADGELEGYIAVAEALDVAEAEDLVLRRREGRREAFDVGEGVACLDASGIVGGCLDEAEGGVGLPLAAVEGEVAADECEPAAHVFYHGPFRTPLPRAYHGLLHDVLGLTGVHGDAECEAVEAVAVGEYGGAEVHAVLVERLGFIV